MAEKPQTPSTDGTTRAVLRLNTPDRPGLVADVSTMLFKLGANIISADQHLDTDLNSFFQRIEFRFAARSEEEREAIRQKIADACEGWKLRVSLRFPDLWKRQVAILCSKRAHCILDLLARHRSGELPMDLPVVISNHRDLEEEVTRRGYRFVHEGITDGNKKDQEARVMRQLADARVDLIILARYMQILSADFVAAYPERIINIHHSFLPAFIGAEPYRQAHRRGVKIIGATSHYVTADLDQGPIIAQGVIRVSHRDSVEEMERKGRDIERNILAHAVRCHLEDRIITYGNKTVVFE
jgi:formyltetrahydrofolate deformylase